MKSICDGRIWVFGILAAFSLTTNAGAEFRDARRVKVADRPPPAKQANRGIEGWARVCVTVGVDGSVSNPRVLDASPGPEFAEAGRKAALGWEFEPARMGEEVVEEHGSCAVQYFTLDVPSDAGSGKRIEEASALLSAEEPDPEAASALLADLVEEGPLSLRQAAALQLVEFRIAASREDFDAALEAIERATVERGRFLEENQVIGSLSARFSGLMNARRYREALELFDGFESMVGGAKPMLVHGEAAAQIRNLRTSGASFPVPARLEAVPGGDAAVWRHIPLRRELGVRKLDGSVDAIEILCERRKLRVDYAEAVSWKIPESWGDCAIWAEGKDGTTFELIEYGIAADATPGEAGGDAENKDAGGDAENKDAGGDAENKDAGGD
jgi:TonB family protein